MAPGPASDPNGSSGRERAVAYAYVAGQAVLLAVVFAPSRRRDRRRRGTGRVATAVSIGTGAALSGAGAATLGRALTALPLPGRDAELRTTGVYARVRHPIYTGVMLASVARAAATASPSRMVAAGLLVCLLDAKATFEERRLAAQFPGYRAYAARTAKFLPMPRRRTPHRADTQNG